LALRNGVILLSAGRGIRFGAAIPKQFTPVGGQPMIQMALQSILKAPTLESVFVMFSPDHEKYIDEADILGLTDTRVRLLEGGTTRGATIQNSIRWVLENCEVDSNTRLVVHDACRPFVSTNLIERFLSAPLSKDALVCFQAPSDAIAFPDVLGKLKVAVASDGVMALNTPIALSLAAARQVASEATNDLSRGLAGYLIGLGLDVGFVEADGSTRKITYSSEASDD
jgi:2-C-methyl-D-erythritol 4-phosphate cytidylyltransferase / 2-C-methyl-D-erythritol 2,4-cyclodiphosphate synthase